MEHLKNYLSLLAAHPVVGGIGATALSVVSLLYGTGATLYAAALFAGVIILDWLAGYRASKIDGSYASEYGIAGGFRTAFMLIVPALAYHTDLLMGLEKLHPIFYYVILNFGLHTWKSMTANVYRCGWHVWIPMSVLEYVADEIENKTARANKRIEEKQKYLNKEGEQ